MVKYCVAGEGFDEVLVDTKVVGNKVISTQYYTRYGKTCKQDESVFTLDNNKYVVDAESRTSDVLVLPDCAKGVCSGALHSVSPSCVIIPARKNFVLDSYSMYTYSGVPQIMSYADNVVYKANCYSKES